MYTFFSRTFFLPLLLAVAVLFIGCDGGGPDVDVADVPAVSFAGGGKTVADDDSTASIAVTISGAPETTVRVEVLFAAQASTAEPEDVGGFTTQAVTFPAGAEAGATEEVTFDLDVELEPGEALQAYFALQQVEGPARIGDGREFVLRIGQDVLPIAEARAQELETVVTVEGTVTRLEGGDTVYLQDETGGIALFIPGSDLYGEATVGAHVQVTGAIGEFGGLIEIVDLQEYAILSEGNDLPAPATITIEELLADGETYESTLVRIEGLTTDAEGAFQAGGAEGNYTVTDGTGEVTLRIPGNSFYGGQPIPEDEFTFEGVLSEYFSGYQLFALLDGDLIYGDDGGNGDDDDPELITITEARGMSDGEVVRVQGIVTRLEGSNVRIQDESGTVGADGADGIVVRSGALADAIETGAISSGGRIQATGPLDAYNGLLQINEDAGDLTYELATEDAGLPAPQSVSSLADIGENYESELVQVEGLTIATDEETFSTDGGDGFGNYTVTDGEGNELLLRIPFGSFYDGEPIPDGAVTFTGVVGQFNGAGPGAREPDTGYQLFAIAEGDLIEP